MKNPSGDTAKHLAKAPAERTSAVVVLEPLRQRISEQVARLDPEDEREALDWIEEVAAFYSILEE